MEKKNILDPLPFKVDDFFTTQEQRDHIIWNASHYVELANEYDE